MSETRLSKEVIHALMSLGANSSEQTVINALKVHGDHQNVIDALYTGANSWRGVDFGRTSTERANIDRGIAKFRDMQHETPPPAVWQQVLDEMRAMREEITALRAAVDDLAGLGGPTDLSKKIGKDEPPLPAPN